MKYYLKIIQIYTIILAFPFSVYAMPSSFAGYINFFLGYVYVIIPILIALSFLSFFWGVAQFILKSGEPAARKVGKDFILGGIIALFILVTFWTLLDFASKEFQFGPVGIPLLPGGQTEVVDTTFKPVY